MINRSLSYAHSILDISNYQDTTKYLYSVSNVHKYHDNLIYRVCMCARVCVRVHTYMYIESKKFAMYRYGSYIVQKYNDSTI